MNWTEKKEIGFSIIRENPLLTRITREITNKKDPHRCEPLKAVENTGIEPVTSCMPCKRSTR